MEQYAEKVQEILEKLIDENPEHSRPMFDLVRCNNITLMPFFSTKSLLLQLNQKVMQRLDECGWKDDVRMECNKAIKKKGLDNANIDGIVNEVLPIARAKIPMELKRELVAMLKDSLMKELEGGPLKP